MVMYTISVCVYYKFIIMYKSNIEKVHRHRNILTVFIGIKIYIVTIIKPIKTG